MSANPVSRPRIRPSYSIFDRIILFAPLVILIYFFYSLYELNLPLDFPVPQKFDWSGNPTIWGTMKLSWLLFYVAAGIYLLFSVLGALPWIHKYPESFNENNARQFYLLSRQRLSVLALTIIISFAGLTLATIDVALQKRTHLNTNWLFFAIIAPVAVAIFYSVRIKKLNEKLKNTVS